MRASSRLKSSRRLFPDEAGRGSRALTAHARILGGLRAGVKPHERGSCRDEDWLISLLATQPFIRYFCG